MYIETFKHLQPVQLEIILLFLGFFQYCKDLHTMQLQFWILNDAVVTISDSYRNSIEILRSENVQAIFSIGLLCPIK